MLFLSNTQSLSIHSLTVNGEFMKASDVKWSLWSQAENTRLSFLWCFSLDRKISRP